jgi:hypothetical protein
LRSRDTPALVEDTSERGRHYSRRLTEIAIWLLIDLSPAVGFRSDAIRGGVVAFVAESAAHSRLQPAFARV